MLDETNKSPGKDVLVKERFLALARRKELVTLSEMPAHGVGPEVCERLLQELLREGVLEPHPAGGFCLCEKFR